LNNTISNVVRLVDPFPREKPSRKDWDLWFDFWHNFTMTGGKLNVPLGKWVKPTHRIWRWYYREQEDNLQRIENGKTYHYKPTSFSHRTRSTSKYQLVREELNPSQTPRGSPTSVLMHIDSRVSKIHKWLRLVTESSCLINFWEFLFSWGRVWMWDRINNIQETKRDLAWIADGMSSNSLISTVNGSHDRKKAADLCGVGWVIFCTKTGLRLTGNFWKRLHAASLYRAEMLSLCALHLLARAVADVYQIQGWHATLCCDNKQALELSSYKQGQIHPSAKCVHIRRNIRSTKQTFQVTFRYVHMYSHMDKYLAWNQLNLMQQMNCVCQMLAKKAVAIALLEGYHNKTTQLLPNEDVAVVIWGNKVTGDIAPVLRFHASKEAAREYLKSQKRNPWPSERFNEVDWEHLNIALKNKADMYKMWRSKQNLGICGTRVQVGIYSGKACVG
jgi:hypothetical protein